MESGIHGDAAAEFSAFIGRDRELRELRALAASARALTLCGAGGIGKTRLALRLLAELAEGYPDGAWFVELADLRQPELVASRIASVIGVTEEPGRPLLATLADALRSRRMLLCLDTCEHLIEACAHACQRLLASSGGLRVIATSREPLRVAAETIWQVPPLSLPAASPGDLAAASDAVRLFADRAASAKPGFTLGPANLPAVTEICRSLDGLPLAIELAAAWVRALTVEQIAARLADRFKLLNLADRTVPARHRTLRDAIDWSHDLLSAEEKILLRRLSVFADWALDMADQVCGRVAGGDDLPPATFVDLLTALADKSFVIAGFDLGGQVRYRMLDTIREYAATRLAESGESELMYRRVRDHTVAVSQELAEIGMARVHANWPDVVDVVARFEAETANLRQVLGRALADGDVESGLRLCVSIRPAWIVQGSFAEGAGWMDAFLRGDTSGLSDEVLGSALVGRAQLAMATDQDAARGYALDGLALCTSAATRFWAASALNLLAGVALHARDLDEATARADAALATARTAGDRWNEAYAASTLAATAAFRGELAEAKKLAEDALAITREIGQQWGAARALLGLGDLARLTGDLGQARQRYSEALAIVREVNAKPEIARCLAGLGQVAITQGDLTAAGGHFADSLALSKSTGSRIGVIRGLDAFAVLAAELRKPEHAVKLAAAAAALRAEAGLPEASQGRRARVLKAAAGLGDAAVSSLWDEGHVLGSDAAISLALTLSVPAWQDRDLTATPEPARPVRPAAGGLTPREVQISGMIAGGATNTAIADALAISPATAARHVANIMGKLGFNSRAQIAAWVLRGKAS